MTTLIEAFLDGQDVVLRHIERSLDKGASIHDIKALVAGMREIIDLKDPRPDTTVGLEVSPPGG